jgi:hypothetical protein
MGVWIPHDSLMMTFQSEAEAPAARNDGQIVQAVASESFAERNLSKHFKVLVCGRFVLVFRDVKPLGLKKFYVVSMPKPVLVV